MPCPRFFAGSSAEQAQGNAWAPTSPSKAPQGLPDSRETRQFAAELLAKVPRKEADKAGAQPPTAAACAENGASRALRALSHAPCLQSYQRDQREAAALVKKQSKYGLIVPDEEASTHAGWGDNPGWPAGARAMEMHLCVLVGGGLNACGPEAV